jgi:hypothetical protein
MPSSDSAEKDKHYQMDLLAICIGLGIIAMGIIFKTDIGFLALVAFVLLVVGSYSLIKRQFFNR